MPSTKTQSCFLEVHTHTHNSKPQLLELQSHTAHRSSRSLLVLSTLLVKPQELLCQSDEENLILSLRKLKGVSCVQLHLTSCSASLKLEAEMHIMDIMHTRAHMSVRVHVGTGEPNWTPFEMRPKGNFKFTFLQVARVTLMGFYNMGGCFKTGESLFVYVICAVKRGPHGPPAMVGVFLVSVQTRGRAAARL